MSVTAHRDTRGYWGSRHAEKALSLTREPQRSFEGSTDVPVVVDLIDGNHVESPLVAEEGAV